MKVKVILAKVPPWGKDWPKVGTTMEVDEALSRDLISSAFAVFPPVPPKSAPVKQAPKVEPAESPGSKAAK
jgi:hypothetical protein